MLLKLTRGLGGRKGLSILLATCVAGVAVLLGAWYFRHLLTRPRGIVVGTLPPEEILRLADKARGPMTELTYAPGDMARVVTFAVAQRDDGHWSGLPEGTILQVTGTSLTKGETWIHGRVEGGVRRENVIVHGSFLERYRPVILNQTIEFSDMRLMHLKEGAHPQMAVSGWLRNITSQTISQCVVACVFQDRDGKRLDVQRSAPVTLPPLELVRFQTGTTGVEKFYGSISVQITYATPDGLRNYLSTVVVQRLATH